jgi:hypothetical protein
MAHSNELELESRRFTMRPVPNSRGRSSRKSFVVDVSSIIHPDCEAGDTYASAGCTALDSSEGVV